MSAPALSLQFFDPEHGLHGNARSGATLLFEGTSSRVLAEGPEVEAHGDGWRAVLEGAFSLTFEPVAPAAELDGVTATVCQVSGRVGEHEVRCLGTAAQTLEPPTWDELDAVRSISGLFDPGTAFLGVARRARGAFGHGEEQTAVWVLRDGEVLAVEDARISTVYDGEGRQRSASLELWLPDEDFPLRASGMVVAGSSLQLERLDAHVAVFRWRMEGREGAGSYELMVRSDREAA